MIQSAVVSQVVPVGFADLAQAAEELFGQELAEDGTQLEVHDRVDTGLLGAIRLSGTLRRTTAMVPSVKVGQVEVIVSPWSAGRSEVAIRPVTDIGAFDSRRANRFFKAAHTILPAVVDRLEAEVPEEVPADLESAA